MTDARTGWGGEVWLHNGTALTELVEVVSFGLPDDETDEVEATHLKSPGRRKEFISGLTDGGEVEVVLNYVPGSPTDTLVRQARAEGDNRPVKFVVPDGDANWEVTTSCFVRGYSRGPIAAGEKMEATIRLRISGAQTEAEGTA